MSLRKSRLSLAVGVVLGATALIPATSFGWSVNTSTGHLQSASGGDTLLFPIYTTVYPVTTSFSVTNTSGAQTIAAKIRFREQEHSMDVLDFIVVLSPNDKFDFTVSQAEGAERPTMSWNDNTCLVGPGAGPSVQFPAPSAFVETSEQMSVGHLEVLGMADLSAAYVTSAGVATDSTDPNAISLAAAAKHDAAGVPANCGILITTLASPGNVNSLNLAGTLLDVDNVLVGRYVITGAGIGIEAGGDAIGIRSSNLGYPTQWITSQSSAACDNPNLADDNCVGNYAWDKLEWDHPHLGEMVNLRKFQLPLTAQNISGDWSNNPDNFVGVDWVLSFPNKYAYLDYIPADQCDGTSPATGWCLLYETRTGYGYPGIWTGADSTDLCISPAELLVYDREEQQAAGNVSVSPGSQTQLELCQELEVFTLAAVGQDVRDSVIQAPERRRIITFENLDAFRGWASLSVPWATSYSHPYIGDSVTGILFTTRNTDDPTINNGSLTDLQKNLGFPVPQEVVIGR